MNIIMGLTQLEKRFLVAATQSGFTEDRFKYDGADNIGDYIDPVTYQNVLSERELQKCIQTLTAKRIIKISQEDSSGLCWFQYTKKGWLIVRDHISKIIATKQEINEKIKYVLESVREKTDMFLKWDSDAMTPGMSVALENIRKNLKPMIDSLEENLSNDFPKN